MDAYTRRTLLHGFKARYFRDYEITASSPWTARYSRRRYPSFLLRYEISDIDMYSFWRSSIDTAIVPLPVKVFLAGIPLTPVSRIAGAIFHAASNPDPETNGCAWLLLDNGPLFRVEPDSFKQGVYKMMDDRVNALLKWVEFQPRPGTYWVTWCEKWYNWRSLLVVQFWSGWLGDQFTIIMSVGISGNFLESRLLFGVLELLWPNWLGISSQAMSNSCMVSISNWDADDAVPS